VAPVISAPGWPPNDPAWQSTPVFGGDPPNTLQGLISECDELIGSLNWRFISPHHAIQVFDRWKRVMSGLSTEHQPVAPDVLPKPDRHRRGLVMQGPSAPIGSILGVDLALLKNHTQAVKDWCKARMSESSLRNNAQKRDRKRDRLKKSSKKRTVTVAAADCARIFKQRQKRDPSVRMKHVVEDYAVKHDCSGASIMRVLNDHPELWKSEKDDKKATKRRH
jgi:hypothetical protein